MARTTRKTNLDENAAGDAVHETTPIIPRKKAKAPGGVVKVTIDINTKGKHGDYIGWRLSQLPEPYSPTVTVIPTGFNTTVLFEDDKQGNVFFISRYLGSIVSEIRVLDESNLKIERIAVTADETVG